LNWEYPTAHLVASVREATTVARWLRERRVTVRTAARSATAHCKDLAGNAMTERRQSGAKRVDHEPLAWPSDEWRVPLTDQVNAFPGELIPSSSGGQSFFSFDMAAANLLGLAHQPGWNVSTRELVVRRQDTSARISRVLVDTDKDRIDVTVEGDRLAGVVLELAGDLPGQTRDLDAEEQQTITFPVSGGPPPGAWLLLRRDGAWLDRRTFPRDSRLPQEPGVEYVVPPLDVFDNSPFSATEQAEIRDAVAALKLIVRTQMPELNAAELKALNSRLDDIGNAVASLGRRQWRDHVYAALLGLSLDRLVPSDVLNQVLQLLARDLPHLFTSLLALPH
jgi:hypothetical protein